MALWDLACRAAGVPLYRLLGDRRRERLPTCASAIFATNNLDRIGREFQGFVAQGYRYVKGGWGHDLATAFGRDARRDLAIASTARDDWAADGDDRRRRRPSRVGWRVAGVLRGRPADRLSVVAWRSRRRPTSRRILTDRGGSLPRWKRRRALGSLVAWGDEPTDPGIAGSGDGRHGMARNVGVRASHGLGLRPIGGSSRHRVTFLANRRSNPTAASRWVVIGSSTFGTTFTMSTPGRSASASELAAGLMISFR